MAPPMGYHRYICGVLVAMRRSESYSQTVLHHRQLRNGESCARNVQSPFSAIADLKPREMRELFG